MAKTEIRGEQVKDLAVAGVDIAPDAVDNTKLANMAASTIKGRITSTGDPMDLSVAQALALLGVEAGATADQSAAEIMAAVLANDGRGSGLIADNVGIYPAYTFLASDTPRSYPLGISVSFVRSETSGFPSYGTLLTVNGYSTAQDGGVFQLYSPYNGSMDGNYAKYRMGLYNNAGWTDWKPFGQSAADLLTLIKGVDGSGSGLDADTVDTYHATTLPVSTPQQTALNLKANAAITLTTTAPLTGGGNLSANRTLAISAATTSAAGSMSAPDKAKLDNATATPTASRIVIADASGKITGWVDVASETVAGKVELATAAETTTGTDTTRAVHPAGLKVELNKKAPTSHASSATTYGVATTANYGHVKLHTTIANGVVDGAPTSNAVFDALALKANVLDMFSGLGSVARWTATANSGTASGWLALGSFFNTADLTHATNLVLRSGSAYTVQKSGVWQIYATLWHMPITNCATIGGAIDTVATTPTDPIAQVTLRRVAGVGASKFQVGCTKYLSSGTSLYLYTYGEGSHYAGYNSRVVELVFAYLGP